MSNAEPRKPRIGIIGCGQIVTLRHAPELASCPDAEVGGFYDLIPDRAQALVAQYGGKVYDSHEQMLADPQIDAVVICTANSTHAPLSTEAIHAGKHVLCEKPIATNLEEAEQLVKLESEVNLICMAAHNQRFTFAHRTAHHLITSGNLGRVLSFRCSLGHPGPESYSINRSIDTWYLNKATSGYGCVTDLGIHKVDVLMYILGENFTELFAFADTLDKKLLNGTPIDVYDNACCIMRTASGVMGTLNLMYTNYAGMDNATTYFCEQGVLEVHYDDSNKARLTMKNGQQVIFAPEHKPRSGIVDTFARSIRYELPSPISFSQALSALQVVFGIVQAAQVGGIIRPTDGGN